jgi:hypothetical protein
MPEVKEKYINPFTDFGFKRLFGEEPNKDLLLDFLNELLKDQQGKITGLTYLKTEQLGKTELDRKAIFDLYCENEKGEKFIVEMQKSKQNFYNKLTFIYFEMPKFNKSIDQLETRFDKWLYVLKNLHKLDRLPEKLKEEIFEKVFEVAEIARFTREEYTSYEDSLKYYRDMKNSLDTAFDEGMVKGIEKGMEKGIEKGLEKGMEKVAKQMLDEKEPLEKILKFTGLTFEQIEKLRDH